MFIRYQSFTKKITAVGTSILFTINNNGLTTSLEEWNDNYTYTVRFRDFTYCILNCSIYEIEVKFNWHEIRFCLDAILYEMRYNMLSNNIMLSKYHGDDVFFIAYMLINDWKLLI